MNPTNPDLEALARRAGPGITMRFGDCLEVLRGYPDASFGALVTDPPYTAAGGSTNGRTEGGSGADTQFFDYWMAAVFAEVRRVMRPDACGFVFCDWRTIGSLGRTIAPDGNRQTGEAWRLSQALVWDRQSIGLGAPFRNSYEMIGFVRGPKFRSELPKNIPTVIPYRYPYGAHEHHGAEKPVGLVRQLIEWAGGVGPVLDPFAGSGTTAVAARELGRDFVGIECAVSAYEVALTRSAASPDPAFRPVRLAAGRCPDCGSVAEWRVGTTPGDESSMECLFNGRAYIQGQASLDFDAGRRCSWRGRVVRCADGSVRFADRRTSP